MNLKTFPINLIIVLSIFCFSACSPKKPKDTQGYKWLKKATNTAIFQLKKASDFYEPGESPRSIKLDGTVRLAGDSDWTNGFFPGSLWLGYEISNDTTLLKEAKAFTKALTPVQYYTYTHDIGFMIGCSFINGYKLTKEEDYLGIIANASKSLATRYSSTVGCFKSWDFGKWEFPVIIDNMMNLELMFWSAKKFNNPTFTKYASSHATQTLKNHYREDYSCYHLVDYDTITGMPIKKQTFQGYSDESTWARGQAWGLYGFIMSYNYTKNTDFLKQAKSIAHFIMNHPRLPKDKIPYWDFDDPTIPKAPRDVSAATIISSAMFELFNVTENQKYLDFGERILKSLSQPRYLAQKGKNKYFILKHSVGSKPHNSEINTPINYADYYYLEALIRYAKIKNIQLKSFL